MTEFKRLHVTPLSHSLLPIVLPTPLCDRAIDITFHEIATFPENNFGYLSLPSADAEHLKRKFHGSVVKGQKMKVNDARPRRGAKDIDLPDHATDPPRKKFRSKDSGHPDPEALPGIELASGRKVKRGWTEAEKGVDGRLTGPKKDEKKRTKKKQRSITGDKECLFVANIPPSGLNVNQETVDVGKKRRRKGNETGILVHEFQNTSRSPGNPPNESISHMNHPAHEYVDGKGWVDKDGNVVEKVKKRGSEQQRAIKASEEQASAVDSEEGLDGEGSVSTGEGNEEPANEKVISRSDRQKGASGKGSARLSVKKRRRGSAASTELDDLQTERVERLSISRSSGSPAPHVEIQPTSAPSSGVHPLEALFKRPQQAASHSQTPKKPHLEVSTSFSFFDPDTEGQEHGDPNLLLPQTPFTQQDFRHRRQRSAAPTPDTALPGKSFGDILGTRDDEEMGSEDSQLNEEATHGEPAQATPSPEREGKKVGQEESENAKWIWEHRGENGRAWKRRKREATKEHKLRERKEKRK